MQCAVDHALNQHLANCDKSQAAHEFTEGFVNDLLNGEEVSKIGTLLDVICELDIDTLSDRLFSFASTQKGSEEEKEALIGLRDLIENKAIEMIEDKAEEIYDAHLENQEEEAAISRYESQLDECANW